MKELAAKKAGNPEGNSLFLSLFLSILFLFLSSFSSSFFTFGERAHHMLTLPSGSNLAACCIRTNFLLGSRGEEGWAATSARQQTTSTFAVSFIFVPLFGFMYGFVLSYFFHLFLVLLRPHPM